MPPQKELLPVLNVEEYSRQRASTVNSRLRSLTIIDLEDIEIVTRSAPNAFQNDLKKKRSTIVTDAAGETEKATVRRFLCLLYCLIIDQ